MRKPIDQVLQEAKVIYAPASPSEAEAARDNWLQHFARNVKKEKGVWIWNDYRWHGFSFELEPCVAGLDALAKYQSQYPARFFVFDEDGEWCYVCERGRYPDLSVCEDDMYVSHHNMKWTMAFTHEQPGIGPFFAERARNKSIQTTA
jgi:hypothetical protein